MSIAELVKEAEAWAEILGASRLPTFAGLPRSHYAARLHAIHRGLICEAKV